MMLRQISTVLVALCIGTALSGCGRSPRVSFYTLGSATRNAAVNQSQGAPSVSVANITLPELVDRPQLVERVTGNRVEILETHRWAEPLKTGISRLFAENIASQLGSDLVTVYPQYAASEPNYKVFVDVQRFESMGSRVSVDAIWTVRRTSAGTINSEKKDTVLLVKTGSSQVNESKEGEGYDALVAAYNRSIVAICREIAQTIQADWVAGR